MEIELRLAASFVVALILAGALLPLTIAIAWRMGFVDRPGGWKTHLGPTPILGGSAVTIGMVATILAFSGDIDRIWPLAALAIALWVVGTVDDRVQLHAWPRVLIEAAAGAVLWNADLGWALPVSDGVNLVLTMVWVVGVINAVNYLDLMDGVAAGTAIGVAAPAVVLAQIEGDAALAVCAMAAAGACCAFLPFNLASPPRTFLGDGGTMPLGLVLAVAVMVPASEHEIGWQALLAGACLVGVPLLDMASRILLRIRERRPLIAPGHDSAASRLRLRVPGPGWVAAAFGTAQLIAGLGTVAAIQGGEGAIAIDFAILLAVGALAMALIHSHRAIPAPVRVTPASDGAATTGATEATVWPAGSPPEPSAQRHAG